jgi:CDP-diacylglycerol--glycerol-3-phosphate 3-phosphatidyltransferase
MNVPNQLTVSRFLLTGLFLLAFLIVFPFSKTVALLLFSAASLTDYFDGVIARRDNLITNFGILMDPLADKILICSAFIVFVGMGLMPSWMAVLIVARELMITGLRLLAAMRNLVLAAEKYGKHKTISQIVAVLAILVMTASGEWGKFGSVVFSSWVPLFSTVALYVATFMTAWSGGCYLWKNRDLYLRDM